MPALRFDTARSDCDPDSSPEPPMIVIIQLHRGGVFGPFTMSFVVNL